MRLWPSALLIVVLHLWAPSADCIVRKSYCPEPPTDQCSPCQNPSTVVYRETLKSQNSLTKEQRWRPHTSWLQNLGQSCSNPKSVVPASRRTRGAADGELCRDGRVGWCRESLKCTLQTALGDFCYGPDHPVAGEGIFPPQVLGKLDFHPQESESGLLPYCVFTS